MAEDRWTRIPVLGWAISGMLEHDRLRGFHKHVKRQLKQRSTFPTEEWRATGLDLADVHLFANRLKSAYAWPNAHITPSDPLLELCYNYTDGLTSVEFVMGIERDFACDMTDEEFAALLEGDVATAIRHVCAKRSAALAEP